jgi:hypothetical protein
MAKKAEKAATVVEAEKAATVVEKTEEKTTNWISVLAGIVVAFAWLLEKLEQQKVSSFLLAFLLAFSVLHLSSPVGVLQKASAVAISILLVDQLVT